MRRIAIVGAGHIGSGIARQLAGSGHEVTVSFSRQPAKLIELAREIGITSDEPARAVRDADVVVVSVPWAVVDDALDAAGDLSGKIVIDTTNQFGKVSGHFGILDLGEVSAAGVNAAKAPGALWVKAFNTLTAGFQRSAAGRTGPDRVVMFYGTDHDAVSHSVEELINSAGFDPVRTGTLARADVGHQEAGGELYGKELHHADAAAAVARLRGTTPAGPRG